MDENQLNNLTPNIDTTSWSLPSAEPVRMPEVGNTPMQFGAPNAKVADLTPAIMGMVNSVRFDALNSVNRKASTDTTLDKMFPGGNKLDLTTEVPLTQTHELLNDGETWLPRYSSYVPGIDNDARLSAQQTNFDKFLNPVKRFISNTSKAPLDIASFVYGVGDAAISGRFDALYDNSFSKYVDDLTTKTNFEYKNYYDKNQSNLGLNLYTWDKFGSGAEFTARMLASEALIAAATGGTSVPASMAKWGLKGALYADRAIEAGNILRTGNKLSRMLRIATEPELAVASQGKNVANTFSRMTGALETAANRGAWGDRLVQLRFATTSPMYEAGFEAMHFRKEAEQDFRDYFAQMGKDPTPEEVNAFSSKMNGAANWVFGLNMGILSISNLAMFGDLLNVKNPLAKLGTSDALKANVFRIGTETGENGLKQAMKAGFWNKTAAYIKPFAQGALIEGVYEEGSQGIASNTLKNYVASSYNKDLMQKTGDYASAFSKAFNDQFSTKEGIEEIAIGALVGGLFGGVGGAINTSREYNQQKGIAELQNRGQEFVNEFRTNSYTNEQLLSLFSHANRFQDLQEKMENADATGNKFEQARLSAETFTSLLNAYHTVGKEAEFISMWSGMLTGMDNEMISESTGLPVAEVDNFKAEQIKNMTEFSSNYSKGREAAQHMYKPNIGGFTEVENNGVKTKVNTQNLIDAFSYAYGMSFFNEKFATETFDAFQTKLSQMTNNNELVEKFGALGALQMADRVAVARYNDLNEQYNEVQKEFNKVADELNTLNRSTEKEGVADKVLTKAKQLESIQNKISELANNKTLLWKSLIDNFYTKMNKVGYAPEMDLSTFTKQVSDIQTSLNNASIDKADKLILNQLLDQFSEANEAYRSYSNLVNRLGDPKYTYRTYRGIFSGTRARMDKSLNEHTKDVLLDIYGNLEDYNVALTNDTSTLTDTVVPEEENVADPLSDTSDATNIDSTKVKLRTKQKELNDLLDGNYSQELQDKIDAIQEETVENTTENQTRKNKPVLDSIAKLKSIFSDIYFKNRDGSILNEGFAEFQNSMNLIEDKFLGLFQAHGMGKSMFGASVNDLISLFDTNIDPNRGGGMLYTTPLEGSKEAASAIGASSAYSNGMFMLVAPAGTALTNIDDVVAILVNDGVVEENPEILNVLREVFPNVVIDKYGNTHKVAKELAGNQSQIEQMEQSRKEEISKLPLVPSVNLDNDPELQQRMDEYQARIDEINARYDEQLNSLESNNNAETQNKIDDIIAEERARLEDEIAEIQGENSVEEKRQRLVDRINELRNQINSSDTIDNVDIRLINQLDVELDMLNNQSTPFDPNDTYFNQLSWIINNIPRLNFENVEQLATISSPSQSNVEEYIGLMEQNGSKSRIAELRDKLLPYNLAEGLSLDGMNILDIIDLYNQAKRIKDINDLQQENLPETEFQKIAKDVKDVETSSGYKAPNVGLNYDGAYIEQKNKNQNIYHIRLTNMLQKALEKGNNPEIIVYNEQGDKLQSIIVTPENLIELGSAYDNARNIKVILSDEVYIRKPLNSTSFIVFGDILPILDLNAYAITGQPTSYNLIYDTNLDGTLSAKESEFDVTIDGNTIPFDKELLNSMKPGDKVTLEFDRNDDYNKTLTESEYVSKGNIYIKKNGKLLNILKATDFQNKSASETWGNLEATRRNVIKASNENKTVELTVANSYIGLPIINLNQDGTAIEVPLDESKIVSYGYVDENGELQGDIARTKIDNSQYLTPLYSYGYRTPVIAFKAYGKVFAFPINVKPKTTNVSSELDNILNDPTLNREQRIFEINNLLELHGLLTNDIALSNVNFDTEKAREALSEIQQKVDITDNQEYMDAEKTAYIDLNNPFMSSKLVLNLLTSDNELNEIKIETDITLGNQNPNVDITTVDFKGRNASEDKLC